MLGESWLYEGAGARGINVGVSSILMAFSAMRQAVTSYNMRMLTGEFC